MLLRVTTVWAVLTTLAWATTDHPTIGVLTVPLAAGGCITAEAQHSTQVSASQSAVAAAAVVEDGSASQPTYHVVVLHVCH